MLYYITSLPDFEISQQFMSVDGKSGIAIDDRRKKVCLIENTSGKIIDSRVVDYKELLSSEIYEDGQTVMRTSRSSQIGGALVGGLLLGGVGAVVGGLSGKSVAADKVKRIELIITVYDTVKPLHILTFLDIENNKGGFVHKEAMNKTRHWHAMVDVLIKQADTDGITSKNNQITIKKNDYDNNMLSINTLIVSCPKCDKSIIISNEFFGEKFQCPYCIHVFTAPNS